MAELDSEVETTAVEAEARSMGWVPEAEWRGPKERWVDADAFVEKGHTVLPILNKQNSELRRDLKAQQAETKRLGELYAASRESIEALEEFHTAETKRQVAEARRSLKDEIKAARADGDVDREVDATAELSKLDAATEAAGKEPPKKEAPKEGQQLSEAEESPAYKAWMEENKSWFGPDKRKTLLAMAIANELRADDLENKLTDKQFFQKVSDELDRRTTGRRSGGEEDDKVEGSRGGGGGARRGGKTYADLPRDAKEACDGFAGRLVGPGRAHKDIASWRAAYAKKHFEGDQA